MTKLGMPILFEYNSVEENCILAQKLQLDFIELNLNFGYCRKEMEEANIKPLLDKYGLQATLHFFDEADFGSYPEVVDAYFSLLKKYIECGKEYLKMINFHNNPGPVVTIAGVKNYIYKKEYSSYIETIVKQLKIAESMLKPYGIQMVIENIDTAPDATFLLDNLLRFHKEGFALNYDIGHDAMDSFRIWTLQEGKTLPFKEFHFHDAINKSCHLSLGKGSMPLKRYKELAEKNNAYVLIEVKSSEDLLESVPYYRSL